MNPGEQKKIIVIGGGLAGLVAAILLQRKNHAVLVIEKKKYPFHRVCGEYISNETLPFLKREGLFPSEAAIPSINRLQLTSVNGYQAVIPLDLGGFGISRYYFDHFLYSLATAAGVNVLQETEASGISFQKQSFSVATTSGLHEADVVLGCFGKRSKIDHALHRKFISARSPYVGVKYHVRINHPDELIALHNFKDGYCGISNVEGGKSNLCYLTHRDNLKKHKSISQLEEAVLFRNPYLKNIFRSADFLFDKPEVINEISFATKRPVENRVLMLGDAAGMIAPLCGNGMAMSIHSAVLACQCVDLFCTGKISREAMESGYATIWATHFTHRLTAGRTIQHLFGSDLMSNIAVGLAKFTPSVAQYLVSKTHGQPF